MYLMTLKGYGVCIIRWDKMLNREGLRVQKQRRERNKEGIKEGKKERKEGKKKEGRKGKGRRESGKEKRKEGKNEMEKHPGLCVKHKQVTPSTKV